MTDQIQDTAVYNVIEMKCIPSKARFIAVRKDSIKKYRSRQKSGAKTGNTELSVCSVRQYGIEAHKFRILGSFESKIEAEIFKAQTIRNRSNLLNMQAASWSGLEMIFIPGTEIPDEFRGRKSTLWGFEALEADEHAE
jgi:hypothetical protein